MTRPQPSRDVATALVTCLEGCSRVTAVPCLLKLSVALTVPVFIKKKKKTLRKPRGCLHDGPSECVLTVCGSQVH